MAPVDYHHPNHRSRDLIDLAKQDRADTLARGAYLGLRVIAAAAEALAASIPALARRSVDHVVRWHRRRQAVRELSALDDRLLKDIGLYRGDIWSVAAELAAQTPARGGGGAKRPDARDRRAEIGGRPAGSYLPAGCG